MNWRMRYGRNWGQLGMKYNVNIKKLSEVADLTVGFVGSMAKHYVDEGVPFLRSTNIRKFKIDMSDIKYISPEFNEKIKKSQLREGDVVIVRTGMPGACTVILKEQEGWNCSDLVIIHPHKEKVLPLYIAAYVNYSTGIINANLVGAVQQHFNVGSAKNMEIAVPSIEIQKKIVGIIQNINEKLDINSRINKNLEQQAQAIFANEFLSLDTLPEGWKQASLIDIADYLNGLAMQKYRPTADESGIPVLKIKELRQGCCDNNSELCSPSIKSDYIIHDGDVIFSWSGSLLVDLWCGGICGLNQHLFKVTSNKYDKCFYYAWTKHHLDRFVAVAADKATTMGHIKRDELAKAEVLIPNEADYNRIGALLQPIYEMIISNRIENKKLAATRDILLPKLMNGEIDMSEVDYE